jgi:hypothetical protein
VLELSVRVHEDIHNSDIMCHVIWKSVCHAAVWWRMHCSTSKIVCRNVTPYYCEGRYGSKWNKNKLVTFLEQTVS